MKTENYESALDDLGYKLRHLRNKNGFATSEEFANAYGLPKIQYWKMENGKTNVTLKSLLRILQIYKMSLEEFFCHDVKKAAA
jgi:transcriptional regulator with XRE-family HTH domain